MNDIEALVELLGGKDTKAGCAAMERLCEISQTSGAVYPYFERIAALLNSGNSYCRNRALALLAANAKWDTARRMDGVLTEYLSHIMDEKPITARQCIGALPTLAAARPDMVPSITKALMEANPYRYNDSMQPLVEKDIRAALEKISAIGQ